MVGDALTACGSMSSRVVRVVMGVLIVILKKSFF